MNAVEIREVLSKITWVPSCVDMEWKWEVKETFDVCNYEMRPEITPIGFLIRTTFQRPDINTGEMGTGYGRWMHIPDGTSKEGIVKTAWLCTELIVRHELMESFLFDGKKIFDPHKTLKDLSYKK